MKVFSLIVCCVLSLSAYSQREVQPPVYLADPTIACFDGMYYMYGTGSKSNKGIPVLQSVDLKTWEVPANTLEGHALEGGKSSFGSHGFWAPQVFKRGGDYYMLYTANENIAIAKSNTPTGLFVQDNIAPLKADKKQIDPFLFFDTDGKAYLYHVRLSNGNTIWAAEFKKDMSGIKEETLTQCITATAPWEDTKEYKSPQIIEGPTVVKHKGLYYLFYSANDFRNKDYAVGYATATSPLGPWKKYEKNPIISRHLIHRNGTGHGDLFRDAGGNWKYVFHAHSNDTAVHPRQTLVVDVEFAPGQLAGEDVVLVKPESLQVPGLKTAISSR